MSEPDFRKMGDPLNDRLPPRRQWLQAGAPNYPLACRRTLVDSVGFALCANDESEEPDYGNDHLARLIANQIMADGHIVGRRRHHSPGSAADVPRGTSNIASLTRVDCSNCGRSHPVDTLCQSSSPTAAIMDQLVVDE